MGFPGGSVRKESTCNARDAGDVGSVPGFGRSPGGGQGTHSSVLAGESSHGQRSLAGYSPYGCKESDTADVTENTGKCTEL